MKIFLNKNDKMVHLINLNCTEIYNKLSLLNIPNDTIRELNYIYSMKSAYSIVEEIEDL